MRIAGGTGTLITALACGLTEDSIDLNAHVTQVRLDGDEVELRFNRPNGLEQTIRAWHVIFALPPRLLEATVSFIPALDAQIARRWRDTPTWMAPHAKLFALYDRPFWRDAGLSGARKAWWGRWSRFTTRQLPQARLPYSALSVFRPSPCAFMTICHHLSSSTPQEWIGLRAWRRA